MENFTVYLNKLGEVGFADQVVHSIISVTGLPHVRAGEIVIFETGQMGQVISFEKESVQVLLLSETKVKPGVKVVRTGELLTIPVGQSLLGGIVDPLGRPQGNSKLKDGLEKRFIDPTPLGLKDRKVVEKPFITGVTMVDLVVPLGQGQRELVIGDRKTGKSHFLLQTLLSQALSGTICIYAGVGKKQHEINDLVSFLEEKNISSKVVVVASHSSDPAGMIFLAPYSAMTIAEYFRDQGLNVLLILDDLTTHARYYREFSLLAQRFPGRSSYPGDIFYTHSRLLERAGNFKKGSITCLPVAETVMGDISGYIQTNLMSMTDGHIYFDINLFDEGRRPAINPLLSVTRVGLQTQTGLLRDISRSLTGFLVQVDRLRQYLHFGAELGESVKLTLNLGDKITAFLDQKSEDIIALDINIVLFAALWAGLWRETEASKMKAEMRLIIEHYISDPSFSQKIKSLIEGSARLNDLVNSLKRDPDIFKTIVRPSSEKPGESVK